MERFVSGRFILALMTAFAAFALGACISQNSWHVEEVTGHLPDLNFSLTADNGRRVTPETYEGHLLLMFGVIVELRVRNQIGKGKSGPEI